MNRRRGSRSSAAIAIGLALASLVVLAALALAACGGSPESGSAASSTTPSTSDPAQVARTEAVVRQLMTAWNNAWSAKKDRRAQSSLYADDVRYYDAAETYYALLTKSDIDAMIQSPEWWKTFRLTLKSSFVSADGRFAAILGRIALRDESGDLPWQPAASVLAVANDKIVWECDYYGGQGVAGQTTPTLAVSSGAVAPGSPAAKTAIAEATATIEQWLAAYNGRDAASFLSFYAEHARYVDLVSPKWRVMTKSQLAADVASRFSRDEFQSKLERPLGSAMDSAYLVSSDGRFAAVQGTYADEIAGGRLVDRPMLVILELRAGQIIREYNYVAMDRALLEP